MKGIEEPVALFGRSSTDQGRFLHQVPEGLINVVTENRIADNKLVNNNLCVIGSFFEIGLNKDVVVGYPKGLMKSYKGIVSEDETNKIIEYFKSIK